MKRRPITAPLALAALALLAACSTEPALLRQARQERLIAEIRTEILKSVVAEKSAVLAMTEEEGQRFSREVEGYQANVNRLRGELRPLIVADARASEIEALDTFDATWSRLEAVDERLLALATANTNLRAARLSIREGAAALDRFVEALAELAQSSADPEALRQLAQTSVAALRSETVLLVHIPTAGDEEMTRLEERIGDLGAEVQRNLARLGDAREPLPEPLARARKAWADYQQVSTEVLRLSRENTDVLSFDVSINEKQRVTEECLDALAALETEVGSGKVGVR